MLEDPFAAIARHLPGPVPEWRTRAASSYVALGDSFTAGTGCPPGERWADRLATALRRRNPSLVYRNLAQEGATSGDVLDQTGAALQLEPDLITVICGANDVLLSVRPDLDLVADRLAAIHDRLHAALPAVLIVTATVPERWRFLGLGPRTRRRVTAGIKELNARTRALAEARGIPLLEVTGHPGLDDPENFNEDGLHPSPLGHARAAREFERLVLSHLDHNHDQGGRI